MAYSDGDDFVDGAILSYQQGIRIKNQWYGATAVTNIQNGMPFVSNVNGVQYVQALGMLSPVGTLPVSDKVANYVVLATDLNSVLTMTNAAARTFTLPSIDGDYIGKFLIITKLGAGSVTIGRADADTINGGTQIANGIADELYSTIFLRVIGATVWAMEWATNPFSWIVT